MFIVALAVIVMALKSIIIMIVLEPPISFAILGTLYLCLLSIYLCDKFNKRRKP